MNKQNDQMVRTILEKYSTKLIQPEICKKCGGRCCKQAGCENHPIDFEYDPEKMYDTLLTGNYSISLLTDSWEPFIQTSYGITLNKEKILSQPIYSLYIRARNQNRPIVDLIHKKEIEGPCVMWNPETGCKLSFEQRPLYGKLLHQQSEGPKGIIKICKSPLDRHLLHESWRDFQEILLTGIINC